jgi:hypothetical protein
MKWVSGIVSLIGLWLAAAPYVYEVGQVTLWNNLAVGIAILLLAGYNFYRMQKGMVASVATASLVALLGLWIAVSPFLLGVESFALLSSNVVLGLLAALLSGYNAYASQQATTPTPSGART